MRRKRLDQLIAHFLIFATLLSVVCLPSFAEVTSNSNKDTGEQLAVDSVGQIPQNVTVIGEDISLRGEFEKHYLLSDGTYLATSYPEAVHFKDENGVWQDIDTTLAYDSESESYKMKNNGFDAEFMTESSSAKLKNKNGRELSWHYELIGTNDEKSVMKLQKKNAKAQKKQNKSVIGKTVTDLDAFVLPNAKSELTFDSAFSDFGADIRYTVSAQKIKEDVVLNEKGKVHALEMVVENCVYTATLTNDGGVIFSDTAGVEYFYIDPPYMYDSKGEGSADIHVALKQSGKKVTVTYTPSKEWLDSSERVYPVTFDPAVITGDYTLNIYDTYVKNGVSLTDAAVDNELIIGSGIVAYCAIANIPYTGHLPVISASFSLTATSMSSGLAGAQLQLHEVSHDVYFNLPETEYETGTHLDTHTIMGNSVITFDVASIALLEACNRAGTNGLCYRIWFDEQTMQYPAETLAVASMDHSLSNKRPVFTLRYGYENPERLISNNPNNADNRYWITDTTALDFGREMLWTGSNYLTGFDTTQVRGHFNFTIDGNDPHGLYIYGCYDQKYISAPQTTGGAVTSGNICLKSLDNATKWIAIRLSSATYAFVLKDSPSMALTRSGSTVIVQQVSAALSESQEWNLISESDQTVNEAVDTHPLQEGAYYINSEVTRTFMTYDNGLKLQAGTEAALGNKMTWQISFIGNGKYTIQSLENPNKYLSLTNGDITLISCDENSIPNSCLFIITNAEGYYIIRSINDNYSYLAGGGSAVYITTSTNANARWRLCKKENYREFQTTKVIYTQVLENQTIDVHANYLNSSYTWVSATDYSYVIDDSDCATIDSSGVMKGEESGYTDISIRHIPTGLLIEGVHFTHSLEDTKTLNLTRDATNQYSLCIAELYNGDKHWFQIDDEGTVSDVLWLSTDTLDWLESNYNKYDQYGGSIYSTEYCVYQAKHKLNNAIQNNQLYDVDSDSDEYHGLWLYFSLLECEYRADILAFLNCVNIVSSCAGIVGQSVILAHNIGVLKNQVIFLSESQYTSASYAVEVLDNITDLQAVTEKVTDVTVYSAPRPTWRQSELYVFSTIYTATQGYFFNPSYVLQSNGVLDKVNWGTPNSVRPDLYNPNTKHCIDVKNYTVTTTSGKNSLVSNVVNQYNQRVDIFPEGTTFEVVIDVRGQEWKQSDLDDITQRISTLTNGEMIITFIKN